MRGQHSNEEGGTCLIMPYTDLDKCNLHVKVGVTNWLNGCINAMKESREGKYSTAQLFHQSKYHKYGHSGWAFCSKLLVERCLFWLALAYESSRMRNVSFI